MTTIELKNWIYEHGKIEYVLEQIGCTHIKYHEYRNYYSCCNPDGGDNPTAINIANTSFLDCKNYTRKGFEDADLITLVMYAKEMDFAQAIKYLHKMFNLPLVYNKPQKEEEKTDVLAVFKKVKKRKRRCNVAEFEALDEDVLDDFTPVIHLDIFKEGVIGKTIRKFGLCYSYKYKRTIYPYRHWITGDLLGYTGRSSIANCEELGIPRYYITPTYQKQNNLFGLYENRVEIEKAGFITLVEAEKSVCLRDSRCDSTCVALSGHSLSDEQLRIILGLNIKEVVIALDNEVSIEEVLHMCEKFYGIRKVSFIKDKEKLLGIKDSPADATNDVYCYLFEHRIVYDERLHNEYLKRLKKTT